MGEGLFIAVFVGLFFDLVGAVAFPRFYWRSSIPLTRTVLDRSMHPSFDLLAGIKDTNPGWTIRWIASETEDFRIGFRERFYGLASLYTPLMHGELVASPEGTVLVTRLNWFPALFLVLFVQAMVFELNEPLYFLVAALVFSLIYFIQRVRFDGFARRCLAIANPEV